MQKLDIQICKFNMALFLRAVLLLSPIILLFYQENGLTAKDLFFFQGIFYLTSIIFEIPIGYFSNNHSRKKLLILSFVIFWGITLLWLFFKGYYIILLGEILFAISKDIMDNATSGYLCDYLESKNMVRNYGYLNFYLAFGTAVAAIIGTFLYSRYGSHFMLLCECILISVSIILAATLPNIRAKREFNINLRQRISDFTENTKKIYHNKSIKYHIYYSGLLTSFSILFAISFQPLMQNALFPIAFFGGIAFTNHIIRSFAGVVAGKWLRNMNIRSLIVPLYILYILAFACIFSVAVIKNIVVDVSLLVLICLIIGVQLMFTILHVSRIHKFVSIKERGSLMSVNNFVSRCFAAIILISSKLFIGKVGLTSFFIAALCIFLIFGSFFMVKTYQVKE